MKRLLNSKLYFFKNNVHFICRLFNDVVDIKYLKLL